LRAALDELARVPTSFILPLVGRAPPDAPAVASDLRVSPRQLLELGVVAGIAGNEAGYEPSPAPHVVTGSRSRRHPERYADKEIANAR
jgi:hypothetical protein